MTAMSLLALVLSLLFAGDVAGSMLDGCRVVDTVFFRFGSLQKRLVSSDEIMVGISCERKGKRMHASRERSPAEATIQMYVGAD